jgi:hypothetical protein
MAASFTLFSPPALIYISDLAAPRRLLQMNVSSATECVCDPAGHAFCSRANERAAPVKFYLRSQTETWFLFCAINFARSLAQLLSLQTLFATLESGEGEDLVRMCFLGSLKTTLYLCVLHIRKAFRVRDEMGRVS